MTIWVYDRTKGHAAQEGFGQNVHKTLFAQLQWLWFLTLSRGRSLLPFLLPSLHLCPPLWHFELRDVKLNAEGRIEVEGQG